MALSAWLTRNNIAHVHIPNGIKIGGDRRGAAGQIACLKDQGMQPGFPDYEVLGPLPVELEHTRGVAIELKTRDAPYGEPWGVRVHAKWLRPNQAAWLERLQGLGWVCRACAGAKDAIEWLRSLGFGAEVEMVESVDMSETVNVNDSAEAPTDAADAVLEALSFSSDPVMRCYGWTSKDLQRATGLDAATLRKTLAKLGERIVKTGNKSGTRYALATEVLTA